MPSLLLPTRSDLGNYSFEVELDGVVFGLIIRFNRRDNRWYFDLLDAEGAPLREGIKVVSNWPLLRTMVQQGRPEREIAAIRANGSDDPDRNTLGLDSFLSYVP